MMSKRLQLPHRTARARHAPGVMNQLEARYAREVLAPRHLAGQIQGWLFEPLKLRIADRCFYEPDFLVISEDDTLEFHEVKGHWEDDARVKIKVAAARFPWFRFVAITRARVVKPPAVQKVPPGTFVFEEVRSHHAG